MEAGSYAVVKEKLHGLSGPWSTLLLFFSLLLGGAKSLLELPSRFHRPSLVL